MLSTPLRTVLFSPSSTNYNTQSLALDGVDDVVTIGTSQLIPDGALSVSGYFYSNGAQSNGLFNLKNSTGLLIYHGSTVGGTSSTMIGFRGLAPKGEMYSPASSVPQNAWVHIVWTFDGVDETAASSFKIYVNRVSQTVTAHGLGIGGSTTNNRIGSDEASDFFNGLMKDVRLFKAVLTQADVNILASPSSFGKLPAALGLSVANSNQVGLLNFQPPLSNATINDTDAIADTSGTGNHGTGSGFAGSATSGISTASLPT